MQYKYTFFTAQIPATHDLVSQSGMPFAVVLQPLTTPVPEEEGLPLAEPVEGGPIRCSRCRAYMNPFMRWAAGGRTFACNFCGHVNPCPDSYFSHVGPDGYRRDMYERPELCRGSVEYAATAEYMARPPMAPAHFFLVDVSAGAVASGATAAVCACIEGALDALQGAWRRNTYA